MSSTHDRFKPNPQIFQSHIHSFKSCTSEIKKCFSADRICNLMLNFAAVKDSEEIVKLCSSYSSLNLLNDYTHLLNDHSDELLYIHNLLKSTIKCSLNGCPSVTRFKLRCDDPNVMQYKDKNDLQPQFYMNLIERIHVFLLHFADRTERSDENKDENKDNESTSTLDQFKLRHNKKFQIQSATENTEEKHDEKQISCDTVGTFSVGHKFYYWSYYKDKNEIDTDYTTEILADKQQDIQYSDLFVEQKYTNLKSEILNNKIQTISIDLFDMIYCEVKEYMETESVKQMKAADVMDCVYEIEFETPINIKQLMSVKLYTDLTELSAKFTATFRKSNSLDTLDDIKNKNKEFANMSKYLREAVGLYGSLWNRKGKNQQKELYVGMSFLIIPSVLMKFSGPTSTTVSAQVATNFTDNQKGIMMTLCTANMYNSRRIRFFDTSWLSQFPFENERLFMGSSIPIKVKKLLLCESSTWIVKECKSLLAFDLMFGGYRVNKITIGDKHVEIIEALVKGKTNDTTNEYIQKSFNYLCNMKKKIVINMDIIHKHFKKFKSILFIGKILNLQTLAVIFENVDVIKIVDSGL
eukprot:243599_1